VSDVTQLKPLAVKRDEKLREHLSAAVERVLEDARPITGYLVVAVRADGGFTFDHNTVMDVSLIGAVATAQQSLITRHVEDNVVQKDD